MGFYPIPQTGGDWEIANEVPYWLGSCELSKINHGIVNVVTCLFDKFKKPWTVGILKLAQIR